MWFGTMTVTFLNPIFFLLAMGVLLGTLVDRSDPDLDGLSYLEFVAPALLATTAMQTAASVTTFPVRAGLKWWRTYHAVVATPVRVHELVTGVVAWAGVRVSSRRHGVRPRGRGRRGVRRRRSRSLAPFAALLCGLAFAAVIAALSAWMKSDQYLAATYRFGLVPLFLFSGTFFPISQLPELARAARLGDAALARGRALPRPRDGRVAARRDRAPRRLSRRPSSSSASRSRCAAARGSSSCEHVRHPLPHPAAPAARHAPLLAPRRAEPRELARLLARLRLGLLRAALLPPRPGRRRRARSSATSSSEARRCRTATSSPPRSSPPRR